MSRLWLSNPLSNDLNKTKMVNNKTNTDMNPIPPNPTNPVFQCTPVKVSLTYKASLKQASATTPSSYSDAKWQSGWQQYHQDYQDCKERRSLWDYCETWFCKWKFNLANHKNMTMYDAFIPNVSPTSSFSMVCFEVGFGSNLVVST